MARSVKTNYILNLINSGSTLLFPVIVFPYASRIMLAEGIGHVDFFQSIMQYVMLITCLGIPMYAIKEIAKNREDILSRNKTLLEIFGLQVILSVFAYITIYIISIIIPEIRADRLLFYILSISIFLNAIGCDWFFQGIEDFKYITIRSIIVKIISICILFLTVHTKDDIYNYAFVLVFGSLGGNIFNFIRICKTVDFHQRWNNLRPFKHLVPALHVFVLTFITTIYVQLNSIMLGFISDDRSVGLFTSASKISHLLLIVGTTLSTTMLPRMSNLIAQNRSEDFEKMCLVLIKFIILISLPLSFGLINSSKEIINIFCGNSYEESILTLKILSPIILVIGLSNVIGIQILFPMGKVNIVIKATAIGALTNVVLNFFLIPLYQHNGAAISTICAETVVTISMILMSKRLISYRKIYRPCLNYIIATLIMFVSLSVTPRPFSYDIANLLTVFCVGVIVYAFALWILKDSFFVILLNDTRKIIKKND